jgi:hypothetical protein
MRYTLLLAALCGAAGCTSLQPVELDTVAETSLIEPGDRVRVTKNDRTVLKLRASEITPTTVKGRTASGEEMTVDAAEIDELAVHQRAPGKTAALVGSLVVAFGLFVDGVKHLPPY